MQVIVTSCEDVSPDPKSTHKEFLVTGTVDGQMFSVTVMPFCSEYDYELLPKFVEYDEPIQIAIGQYFVDHNIDVGRVGR